MQHTLTRRRFLAATGATVAALSCPAILRANPAPKVERIFLKTLNPDREAYLGWPTIGRTASGELLVVCSGNREGHVCPFGQVWLYRSRDNGETWTWPQSIYDGPIDDRDAGILVTARGTILISSFTSLAYWDHGLKQETEARRLGNGKWNDERFARWNAVHNRIAEPEKELGCWLFRSTDGGVNWDVRIDSLVNSPHGPIQLKDGRLLYPGKELWKTPARNGLSVSDDDGATWSWGGEIPIRPGDGPEWYHELHGVETDSGKVIVQIRNHNPANEGETLQTESSDGGKTWSTPREIGVWGLPSHLLKLRDGRILMVYGHRRPPFGNQARISENEGQTWSAPITISDDGIGGDLGYPSTAQLDDGSLATVWYEVQAGSSKAVLRIARWKL
ncbi:MAG: glycoside hydrolase [Planctomycetaceae bacterium]|nr:glycoside hydrolase [Planctomycetaceae bacterium]